jgi:hypothetical protein
VKRQKFYIIQLYRLRPGDVAARDMPTIGEDLAAAELAASKKLLAAFNDDRYPDYERPHHAHLVDEDGFIAVQLMVNGFRKVQRC